MTLTDGEGDSVQEGDVYCFITGTLQVAEPTRNKVISTGFNKCVMLSRILLLSPVVTDQQHLTPN